MLKVLLYEREMLYIWVKDDGVGVVSKSDEDTGKSERRISSNIPMWDGKIQRKCSGSCMEMIIKFQVWSEPGKGTEIEIAVPIERGGNYVESGSSR